MYPLSFMVREQERIFKKLKKIRRKNKYFNLKIWVLAKFVHKYEVEKVKKF